MINSLPVTSPIRTTHIIVRSFGLHVAHDAYFKEIGTLTSLYAYATSNSIKNEKRYLRVMQSAPFPVTYGPGRPPSYVYDTLMESEVFEDIQDISPSLVADVKCPENMDCRIQINVFYSSNRTSGKEVILCTVTFSLREFLKIVEQKGVYLINMSSDYCIAPKAYVELFIPFPKVLKSDAFVIHASKKLKNPLLQKYVFYTDNDNTSPRLDVLELTWEPRLAFTIPLLFLDSIISGIKKSIMSWKQRQHLERMRQGLFINTQEALQRNWHELQVTVHAVKLFPILRSYPIEKAKPGSQLLMTLSSLSSDDITSQSTTGNISSVLGNPSTNKSVSNAMLAGLGSSTEHTPIYASLDSTKKALANYNTVKPIVDRQRKFDESLPSTFVNVTVIDSTLTFQLPVGKTNIERYSLEAIYGSNVNASSSRKNTTFVSTSEDVRMVSTQKSYTFVWVESPNNLDNASENNKPIRSTSDPCHSSSDEYDSTMNVTSEVNRAHSTGTTNTTSSNNNYSGNSITNNTPVKHRDSKLSSGLLGITDWENTESGRKYSSGEDLMTVKGEEVTFLKFIPHRSHTSIEFEVNILDGSGKSEVLGTSSMPLTTIYDKTIWLPVQISSEFSKQYANATVKVSVKLKSPIDVDSNNSNNNSNNININSDDNNNDSNNDNNSNSNNTEYSNLLVSKVVNPAAPEFPEIFNYERDDTGNIECLNEVGAPEDLYEEFRHVIPECYSWLWYIGAYDQDPLSLQPNHNHGFSSSSSIPTKRSTGNTTNTVNTENIFQSEDSVLEQLISDENVLNSNNSFTASTTTKRRSSINVNIIPTVKRIDCPLSIRWINEHVQRLESLADDLMEMRLFVSSQTLPAVNATFRPSVQKKDYDVQALPINLHYQLLATRDHQYPNEPLNVEGSITSGSFSPHGLGHKKGGLYQQENELNQLRSNINDLKSEYLVELRKTGSLAVPRNHHTYELLQEIGRRYCKYESQIIAVAHRRILALSQGLSTAINAFHLKMGLMADGHLSNAAGEQWLEHGMLLVFQGLLSVIANEKSMLEDTSCVVETLNLFSIRICSSEEPKRSTCMSLDSNRRVSGLSVVSEDTEENMMQSVTVGAENDDAVLDERMTLYSDTQGGMGDIDPDFNYIDKLKLEEDKVLSETQLKSDLQPTLTSTLTTNSTSTIQSISSRSSLPLHPDKRKETLSRRISAAANKSTGHTASEEDIISSQTSIVIHGRQIVIYLPQQSLVKLPKSYQELTVPGGPGAFIRLHTVLFTQGIDMQQTVASTFTNESSGGLGFQSDINMRGLRHLNRYCHIIQPLNATISFKESMNASKDLLSSMRTTSATSTTSAPKSISRGDIEGRTVSSILLPVDENEIHPLMVDIHSSLVNYKNSVKNIEMLTEVERVCQFLRGCKITFCKSGKDRTGMVVTFEQARQLNDRYALSKSLDNVIHIANIMRIHGTRILVAEKNIGRKIFSINKLQAQFFPVIYRPPGQVCEDILKKDLS